MGAGASQHSGTIPLPMLNGDVHWAHYSMQGKRESMEDAFQIETTGQEAIFSVFDGHYGKRAAVYASQHLANVIQNTKAFQSKNYPTALSDGYEALDKQLLDVSRVGQWHDGTTSLSLLLTMADISSKKRSKPQTQLTGFHRVLTDSSDSADTYDATITTLDGCQFMTAYLANAGDCRAISVYGDGRTLQLTTDHNPSVPYEQYRIYKAGGYIRNGRIDAKLSVSRGFGDRQFKEPKYLVSASPEVVSFRVTKDLRAVVLACDGIWGWLTNTQVADFVALKLKDGKSPEDVCKDLVKHAFDMGSTDNISAIVLYFSFNPDRENHTPSPLYSSLDPASANIASTSANANNQAALLDTKADFSLQPSKKINYKAIASLLSWPDTTKELRTFGARSDVLCTHIPTGTNSVYLDDSLLSASGDPDGEFDRRISCDMSRITDEAQDTRESEDVAKTDTTSRQKLKGGSEKIRKSKDGLSTKKKSEKTTQKHSQLASSDPTSSSGKVSPPPQKPSDSSMPVNDNDDSSSSSTSTSSDETVQLPKPKKVQVTRQSSDGTDTSSTSTESGSSGKSLSKVKKTKIKPNSPDQSPKQSPNQSMSKSASKVRKKKKIKIEREANSDPESSNSSDEEVKFTRRAVSIDEPPPVIKKKKLSLKSSK